jgi:hypothetical protein
MALTLNYLYKTKTNFSIPVFKLIKLYSFNLFLANYNLSKRAFQPSVENTLRVKNYNKSKVFLTF